MDLPKKDVFDLMIHQIEFLKLVFGENIMENIGFYVKNDTVVETETIRQLQKIGGNDVKV